MTDDQIHWFSIINSLMIVLFLSGMVAMIMMRTAAPRHLQVQPAGDPGGGAGGDRLEARAWGRVPPANSAGLLCVYCRHGCPVHRLHSRHHDLRSCWASYLRPTGGAS